MRKCWVTKNDRGEIMRVKPTKKLILCAFAAIILACLPLVTSAQEAGQVSVSYGSLNVRNGASTSADILTSLKNGSYVTLISKNGSWWYAEYQDGEFGYLHADYITVQGEEKRVKLTWGSLNVRSGAGTSYQKVASLKNGEEVVVLKSENGWSKILYNANKIGYVSSKYLEDVSDYSAVKLSVPSYKQADPRWASVTLGSSGKLMRYIGCATTGIAMMESYRTGSNIYPDQMAKKLSYTSSGNVYWPSNFVAVTNKTGYLEAIYQKLASGKPVLLGAKTSSGKQHWVVVVGFEGSSLSPSGFIINDPGSKTRTRLSQFLAEYPIFYKYFYYK